MSPRWLWAGLALAALEGCRRSARASRRLDLADTVCLVTGGSRGLGLAIARRLLAKGARVALAARDVDELASALLQFADPSRVAAIRCDVRDRGEVERAVEAVVAEWGAIDVLINNAGVIQVGPLDNMQLVDFENAMNVHFWGPLYFIHAAIPHMRRQGRGRIVNVASVGGRVAVPHLAPYCASKFALVGLSDALRPALAPHGIAVTTACPWLMRTGSSLAGATLKGVHDAEFAWFSALSSLPLLTVDADRAARRLVRAAEYGEPFVGTSPFTHLASIANAVAPGIMSKAMGLVERVLPRDAGPAGDDPEDAREAFHRRGPSLVTRLSERAAARNNEKV